MERPSGYQYIKILDDWLSEKNASMFSGKMIYPRQLEIHLPSNKEIACDFKCYYCQGSALDMNLGLNEERCLKLLEDVGPSKFEYYVFGGAYTEPLLNPYMLRFLKLTKKNKAFFGIHTNGSQLKKLEEKENFCTQAIEMMEEKDYISVSLDAGSPESHMKTKSIKYDAWTDIIKGLEILTKLRDKKNSNTQIRVAYLLNKWNSSEKEIKHFVDVAKDLKVDSLRFSIPYAQYGKKIEKVIDYKKKVEIALNEKYSKMLSKYCSVSSNDKPYIFYFAPYNQDVERMLKPNYKQCAYTYYQITIGADGNVYRCSSIASPTFDYGNVGKMPDTREQFEELILEIQDEKFHCKTCLNATARCNRLALEINTEWNERNKGNNDIAVENSTHLVGPNVVEGKMAYIDKNLHTKRNNFNSKLN